MAFILFYIGFYCILVVLLLVRVCCCCCCCCARTSLSVLLFLYCNPARCCLCQFVVAAATITIVPCRGINYNLLGNPRLFLYHAPYRFNSFSSGNPPRVVAAADTIMPRYRLSIPRLCLVVVLFERVCCCCCCCCCCCYY